VLHVYILFFLLLLTSFFCSVYSTRIFSCSTCEPSLRAPLPSPRHHAEKHTILTLVFLLLHSSILFSSSSLPPSHCHAPLLLVLRLLLLLLILLFLLLLLDMLLLLMLLISMLFLLIVILHLFLLVLHHHYPPSLSPSPTLPSSSPPLRPRRCTPFPSSSCSSSSTSFQRLKITLRCAYLSKRTHRDECPHTHVGSQQLPPTTTHELPPS